MGFHAIASIFVDGPIEFRFAIDSNTKITAIGELAWKDATGKSGGLRFTQLSEDARKTSALGRRIGGQGKCPGRSEGHRQSDFNGDWGGGRSAAKRNESCSKRRDESRPRRRRASCRGSGERSENRAERKRPSGAGPQYRTRCPGRFASHRIRYEHIRHEPADDAPSGLDCCSRRERSRCRRGHQGRGPVERQCSACDYRDADENRAKRKAGQPFGYHNAGGGFLGCGYRNADPKNRGERRRGATLAPVMAAPAVKAAPNGKAETAQARGVPAAASAAPAKIRENGKSELAASVNIPPSIPANESKAQTTRNPFRGLPGWIAVRFSIIEGLRSTARRSMSFRCSHRRRMLRFQSPLRRRLSPRSSRTRLPRWC